MNTIRSTVLKYLEQSVNVRDEEVRALLWSFAFFFFLLCAYYILRPVRDAMGIIDGTKNLPWLFTATFLTMLAIVPLFGSIVSRFPRRVFLPVVYWFFIFNLLLFYAALHYKPFEVYAARTFFVWVSVFNLFVISVFWSSMADMFSNEQGKRLFGFIAAGGTIGALTGPIISAGLAKTVGIPNLLLISAVLLMGALFCIRQLLKITKMAQSNTSTGESVDEIIIGGGIFSGAVQAFRSPYLMGICIYFLIYTTLSTFLYLQQADIIKSGFDSKEEHTQIFAIIDFAANALTLLTQFFITGRFVKRFGLGIALSLVPIVSIIGFAVLSVYPTLIVIIVFQAVRRASNYAISRPAREALFTVVTPEEKYKSKNFIDTAVYRGGDAVSSWARSGLKAMGASLATISLIAVPIAAIGCIVAILLGRKQNDLANSTETPNK